jgi:triacylglycerol esterase/lipase EstA (alpha/beta hydrolase family)
MSDISSTDNILEVGSEVIELESRIMEIETLGDRIFVLIEGTAADGSDNPNNVICFSKGGSWLWEIEKPNRSASYSEPTFKHITIENGELFAFNWNTYKYKVDLNDGTIEEIKKADK